MIAQLTNHLWQSTIFAAAAALLALALRRHRAHVRYWVWFAASVKFLVPFTVLIALGALVPMRPARPTAPSTPLPAFSVAVDQIAQPFPSTPSIAVTRVSRRIEWGPILFGIWLLACAAIVALRLRGWHRIRRAVRASAPLTLSAGTHALDVRSAPGMLEPGVVGIRRPILLLPERITECLTPVQLETVVVHEQCHVQRRDNLTAAVHMLVEAVFWFHPLVWWIGPRLVAERERACDEAVLTRGFPPRDYADAILSVCKLYVESPLACVAGVTGSDLRRRIDDIMISRIGVSLNGRRKAVLWLASAAAIVLPLAIGAVTAPLRAQTTSAAPTSGQTFDIVSVKPCDPKNPASGGQRGRGAGGSVSPGRLVENCLTLTNLIQNAYIRFADGRGHDAWAIRDTPIEGGRDWIKHEPYMIEATAESTISQEMMRGPLLQAVLEDRFHLKLHREKRQGPVYDLVVAASGSKLTPAKAGVCVPPDWTVFPMPPLPDDQHRCAITGKLVDANGTKVVARIETSTYTITWDDEAISLDDLATDFLHLDRPVVNKTGIAGLVSFHLTHHFDRTDSQPDSPPTDAHAAATDFKEQLGLELRPSTGPREFLVIDHVERPTSNSGASVPPARASGPGK